MRLDWAVALVDSASKMAPVASKLFTYVFTFWSTPAVVTA
jgi:hypothetical protein